MSEETPLFAVYAAGAPLTGSLAVGTGLRKLSYISGETGRDNTIIGMNSGGSLTTGYGNTILGANNGGALTGIDVHSSYGAPLGNVGNTLVGRNIGNAADGALDNSFLGVNAGQNLTKGMDNVGIGVNVLASIEEGSENAAIGHAALMYVIGAGSYDTGTGHRLTAVGDMAGRFLNFAGGNKTGGKNSLYLGARTASASNSAVNETVIGPDAEGEGSNTVVIGGSAVTKHFLKGGVATTTAAANLHRDPATGEIKRSTGEWSTWTPTFSAEVGTLSSVTTNTARFVWLNPKTVAFTLDVTFTDKGTAAGAFGATLPSSAGSPSALSGFDQLTTGAALAAKIRPGDLSQLSVVNGDGASTIATGRRIIVSGTYEAA